MTQLKRKLRNNCILYVSKFLQNYVVNYTQRFRTFVQEYFYKFLLSSFCFFIKIIKVPQVEQNII